MGNDEGGDFRVVLKQNHNRRLALSNRVDRSELADGERGIVHRIELGPAGDVACTAVAVACLDAELLRHVHLADALLRRNAQAGHFGCGLHLRQNAS